jgi:hypothetical protein
MAATCFFCQSLLSDFVEGILPASRHEELKKHIDGCSLCKEMHGDLVSTIKMLKNIDPPELSGDLSQRITEASEKGGVPYFTRERLSRLALLSMVPILLIATFSVVFPNAFPLMSYLQRTGEDAQFVRYFPLLQGALEIVEEQGSLLHSREPFTGSLWEEGGLSPDEFEKTFQKKGSKGAELGTESGPNNGIDQ